MRLILSYDFSLFSIVLDEHIDIERRLIGSNLQHVVFDDVDTLIDITFCPAVAEIIRRLEVSDEHIQKKVHVNDPAIVQLVFVSATIPTTTEESLKELINVCTDQIDKMLTPSVHRIMPHVPQKFYRVGSQQKFGLLLKLVKYDLEKKHFCFIFSNKTSRVQFLQQFFRDQRIEIFVMHIQMT
ncbi:unnamed protein product [Rotaria sp. Silwood2]|nr:unnamed protein product [Rotaria sp. Silwood2]